MCAGHTVLSRLRITPTNAMHLLQRILAGANSIIERFLLSPGMMPIMLFRRRYAWPLATLPSLKASRVLILAEKTIRTMRCAGIATSHTVDSFTAV